MRIFCQLSTSKDVWAACQGLLTEHLSEIRGRWDCEDSAILNGKIPGINWCRHRRMLSQVVGGCWRVLAWHRSYWYPFGDLGTKLPVWGRSTNPVIWPALWVISTQSSTIIMHGLSPHSHRNSLWQKNRHSGSTGNHAANPRTLSKSSVHGHRGETPTHFNASLHWARLQFGLQPWQHCGC